MDRPVQRTVKTPAKRALALIVLMVALFTVVEGFILWFGGVAVLAASGAGRSGQVVVTDCAGTTRGEDVCRGDFTPDDGSAMRRDVRVDGVGYSEGRRIKARMVMAGRVQVTSVGTLVKYLVGFVAMGAFWLVSVAGLMGWVKTRRAASARST